MPSINCNDRNDYVQLSSDISTNSAGRSTAMTFHWWFLEYDGYSLSSDRLWNAMSGGQERRWFDWGKSTEFLKTRSYNSGTNSQFDTALDDDTYQTGAWHCLTVTIDQSDPTVDIEQWFDGASLSGTQTSGTGTASSCDTNLYMVGTDIANVGVLNIDYTEAAWWSRILTEPEILSLHDGFSPLFYGSDLEFYFTSRHADISGTLDTDLIGAVTQDQNRGTPTVSANIGPVIIYPENPIIGFPSAGGATTYSESVTMAHALALSQTNALVAAESVSTSFALSFVQTNNAVIEAAVSVAAALSFDTTPGLVFDESVSLAAALAFEQTHNVTKDEAVSLAIGLSLSSAPILTAESSISVAYAITHEVATTHTIEEAMTLGLAISLEPLAGLSLDEAIAVAYALGFEASEDLVPGGVGPKGEYIIKFRRRRR